MQRAHLTRRRGFTLIELLIVVAIIAILAGIALPNFLEAQTRAKVSRTMADLRSVATALEAYRIDQNQYPAENYPSPDLEMTPDGGTALPNQIKLRPITTPVAYITALPTDPFADIDDPLNMIPAPTYHYAALNDVLYPGAAFFSGDNPLNRQCQWVIQSNGPDRSPSSPHWQFPEYDPTNGTVSLGNVLRLGP
ncbi:prepilin-type N-terminal cleavage/methylation domain-containing protein [Candidatus Sumerlaeota bacterium]|nr:prepilin-type N-terminal cleavage/methylation domain-containing protein [Candidatus Sumerlaeota bacterium]